MQGNKSPKGLLLETMNELKNTAGDSTADQNERNLAALAHASVILPYLGAIVPTLILVTRKEKSMYLAFQTLQALLFQVSVMLTWLVGFVCYFITFVVNIISLPFIIKESGEISSINWMMAVMPLIMIVLIILLVLAYIVYGVVGAVMTYQGKPFRYIVIGRWAERISHSIQNQVKAE